MLAGRPNHVVLVHTLAADPITADQPRSIATIHIYRGAAGEKDHTLLIGQRRALSRLMKEREDALLRPLQLYERKPPAGNRCLPFFRDQETACRSRFRFTDAAPADLDRRLGRCLADLTAPCLDNCNSIRTRVLTPSELAELCRSATIPSDSNR